MVEREKSKIKGEPKEPPLLKPVNAPPKKEKPGSKAQAKGMSIHDLKACQTALKRINPSKHARIFLQPVDPIRDNAPE